MKKVLVVVDMQHDFVTGALGTEEARAIVPRVKELAEGAEEVVYTADTHTEEYLSTREGRLLPVPHCIKGTKGWEILPEVYRAGAKIFEKPAFGSVALAEYLKAGGYDEISFCGVCTDICVVSNALLAKAYLPEAEVRVYASACAGVTPALHDAALQTMRSCQVTVEEIALD